MYNATFNALTGNNAAAVCSSTLCPWALSCRPPGSSLLWLFRSGLAVHLASFLSLVREFSAQSAKVPMDGPSLSSLPSQVPPAGSAWLPQPVPARKTPSFVGLSGGLVGGSLSLGLHSRKRKGVPFTPTREERLRFKKTSRVASSSSSSASVFPQAGKVISRVARAENALPTSSSSSSQAGKVIPFCMRTGSDHPCLPLGPKTSGKSCEVVDKNEWEIKPSRVGGPGRRLYLRGSKLTARRPRSRDPETEPPPPRSSPDCRRKEFPEGQNRASRRAGAAVRPYLAKRVNITLRYR